MSKNKVTHTIERANLPSHGISQDIVNFTGTYENVLYVPGEKISVEKLKDYPGLKCIEVEILPMPGLEEREEDMELYEDYETKVRLTVHVFDTHKDSIKQKLDSWISKESLCMKHVSHEVINSTASLQVVSVILLTDFDAPGHTFGDVIESPFLDKYNNYMKNMITEGVCYIHGKVKVSSRDSLRKNINHLAENSVVDYHPNSNDIVRDLVHPALYSYIKGISKLKSDCHIQTKSDGSKTSDYWGREYEDSTFQWLPTPFSISIDGKCTITEYINNLNQQKFQALYTDLEYLFEGFLPYFEEVWSYIKTTSFFRGEHDSDFDENVDLPTEKVKVNLKGCELQVIVKIVDYILQPGQTYEGVWHAEGMSHENIVMTGIYFLDRDIDITGGDLRFKRAFTLAERNQVFVNVPQGRPRVIDKLAREGFVPLGNFPTEEGYMLVFPNCHVHKIGKMLNTSEKKTSSRRVIVFFVVNPEQTIISTRDVAPQQDEISIQQAKTYRLELMHERKYNKDELNVRDIELCEH